MAAQKTCFFLGHREADERLLPRLEQTIEELIQSGQAAYFYVGSYGGFDRLAVSALRRAKARHPQITLMRMLAYPPKPGTELPRGFDGFYCPEGLEGVPKRFAIPRANRLMALQCDYLVCYVTHSASNAGKILAYARRNSSVQIRNLTAGQPPSHPLPEDPPGKCS